MYVAGMSSSSAAAVAPISVPARRWTATSVVCSRLGFIATMAAIGSHTPWERFSPNASAVVPAMTTARITANMIVGPVSGCREVSPGSSATHWGTSLRPRISHAMNVTAIHSATPPVQAST